MGDKIDNMIEAFQKNEERKNKKKKLKKFLIFLLVIVIIIVLFWSTVIVKKINRSKLTDEYCKYNGEHPIENGMKETTHAMCKWCSDIMEFEYTITDELCESCANELNRCKRCGGLLEN